jgi:hypothetical protein
MREFLDLEISLGRLDAGESDYLIQKLSVANLALTHFLREKISFADYLDILETCGIGIDNYLIQVEENLNQGGVIV